MKNFIIKQLDQSNYQVSGIIDEHSHFDDTIAKITEESWIDLSEVTRINSCGVREWIRMIQNIPVKIHLVNCSSVITSQFLIVSEFLGPHGIVDSFEAILICESCDCEISRMIRFHDIQRLALLSASEPCPKCGGILEFDQDPQIYEEFYFKIKNKLAKQAGINN